MLLDDATGALVWKSVVLSRDAEAMGRLQTHEQENNQEREQELSKVMRLGKHKSSNGDEALLARKLEAADG